MKKCNQCKEVKTLDEFHKNSNCSDGRHTFCKSCRNHYRRSKGYISKKSINSNQKILKSYLTKELNRVKDEIEGAKDQVSGYKSLYDSARLKLNELKIVEMSIKTQLKE